MFELKTQEVRLVKVSTPMENHGKDLKLACVLTLEAAMPNDSLKHFAPDLRDALYRTATKDDDVDMTADPETPSVLRFPKMSPFDWDWAGAGYTATVDYGLGDESNIVMGDAKLDSFSFTPMQGGTVVARFNIIAHPDELHVGRLCAKQKQNITLTLTAPGAENDDGQQDFIDQQAA